jgi:hypothetical protein
MLIIATEVKERIKVKGNYFTVKQYHLGMSSLEDIV